LHELTDLELFLFKLSGNITCWLAGGLQKGDNDSLTSAFPHSTKTTNKCR